MAAIAGCGVSNMIVEIDGAEVPIMDGSSAPFVFLLECAGVVVQTAPQQVIRVRETVRVEEGDKYAELRPGVGFSAELEIAFENCPVIDRQFYSFDLDAPSFKAGRTGTLGGKSTRLSSGSISKIGPFCATAVSEAKPKTAINAARRGRTSILRSE